ncbi:MAG TPA: hypothetical protein P5246_03450 [Candidatus Omnitrophota bacterium]|nr:hypothetical protein [Candidatus Omnitrophota bacterium]
MQWMDAAVRFFWIIGAVCLGWFLILTVRPFDMSLLLAEPEVSGAAESGGSSKALQGPFLAESDLSFVEQRNFFALRPGASSGAPEESLEDLNALGGPSDFIKQYKLVGIVIDDHPQAVFESLMDGSVVFLEKDKSLEGHTLKDVTPGEIELEHQGSLLSVKLLQGP